MKIISKYSDFYDSYGYLLGDPDNRITYIRKPSVPDLKLFENAGLSKYLFEIHAEHYYKDYFRIYEGKNYKAAVINDLIVGIYPFIYICPFYVIVQYYDQENLGVVEDIKPISISIEDVQVKQNRNKVYAKVKNIFDVYCKKRNIKESLNIDIAEISDSWLEWEYRTYNYIEDPWKIENPNVFRILNAPTFIQVKFNSDIEKKLNLGAEKEDPNYRGLIINPIFTKFPFSVMGANTNDIMNDTNIYNNIENFLYEMKKEPEANPDNNTRIINAGFDLKTSFRKMKKIKE